MNNEPLITIVICAYNVGAYAEPSLQSVLEQSYANLEIIIVDDGTTDGSLDFVHSICDDRVRLITQQNFGKPSALNRALDELAGEFYAIHDADDLSHPFRIERQLEVFRRAPDLAAVFCGHELLLDGKRVAPRFREKRREACRFDIDNFRMPAHDPTGMYRVSLVRGLRYETTLQVGEGLDYILRVGENHPMVVLGECLYSYRIHSDSLTKRVNPENRARQLKEVYRRACARRGLTFEDAGGGPGPVRMTNRDFDNGVASDFMESVVDLRGSGRWLEAVLTGLHCVRLCPFDAHYYKALLYALIPTELRRRIRPSERQRQGG